MSDLTITAPTALAVLTDGAKFDAFYERIKAEAAALKPDLTTERGRKAIVAGEIPNVRLTF